jgi:hypothetical protein
VSKPQKMIGFTLTLLVVLALVLAIGLGLLLGYSAGMRKAEAKGDDRVPRPAHEFQR